MKGLLSGFLLKLRRCWLEFCEYEGGMIFGLFVIKDFLTLEVLIHIPLQFISRAPEDNVISIRLWILFKDVMI